MWMQHSSIANCVTEGIVGLAICFMGRGSVFGLRLVGLAHVGCWVGLCLCVGIVGALCGLAGP